MRSLNLTGLCLLLLAMFGCTTPQKPVPLAYFAIEKPSGVITSQVQQPIDLSFSRGGWYFMNYGFRPAPDIGTYIAEAEKQQPRKIFRNLDVETNVPFAFDILFCGYNSGSDKITADPSR